MELNDFRKADCRLFRVPPIDFSSVEGSIETALIEAWKNQSSAGNAIGSITENKGIIKNLSEQISESLEFQRRIALERVTKQEAERVRAYQEEQRAKMASVEQTIGYRAGEKLAELKAKEADLSGRRKSYDASQYSLEQTRFKIRERLDSIGSDKSVEVLLKMNESLLDETPTEQKKDERKTETPAYTEPKNYQTNPKPASRGRRIVKKIWEVLNYKIW